MSHISSFAPLTGRAPRNMAEELRALLSLAVPLAGTSVLSMAVYATDVIFVARLGTDDLAAATLGAYFFWVMLTGVMGVAGGAAPLIAAELGRRAHAVRDVRRSVRMALWLSVLLCLPLMAICAAGETILLLLGQSPAIAARAGPFLDLLMWAAMPMAMASVLRIVISALGRAGWATLVTAIALLLNALCHWLFVFGNGGMPAMGLEGSAVSNIITSNFTLLAHVLICVADRRIRRYRLFGYWWRADWHRLREILRIGTPIGLTQIAEGSLFSVAAFLMGLISAVQVAAHALAMQLAALLFQIALGVSQAATIRVGMAYGAGDRLWITRAGRAAIFVTMGWEAISALLLLAMPQLLLSAYIDINAPANFAVVTMATQFLLIAAAFQFFDGAQVVGLGILRGVQDTRVPMLIALFGYWAAGFGCSLLFGFALGWGGIGIWVGLLVGLLVVSVLLLARWHRRAALGLLPR